MLLKEICSEEKLIKILRTTTIVFVDFEDVDADENDENNSWSEYCINIYYSGMCKYLKIYLEEVTLEFTLEQLLNAEVQGSGLYVDDYCLSLYRKQAFNFGNNTWQN